MQNTIEIECPQESFTLLNQPSKSALKGAESSFQI
jgi:hypothetical protein